MLAEFVIDSAISVFNVRSTAFFTDDQLCGSHLS